MNLINRVTAAPLQTQTLILDDGTPFTMTLYFRPNQQGWFINSLTYLDFALRGLRVCSSPNMLYQWSNRLPFGLACITTLGREPSLQQDFLTGNFKLYVLTQAEVTEYVEFLRGG